jgi:aspartate/methionine/tyrosine aminotransferase
MNPIARELNSVIEKGNPSIMEMLSDIGHNLFFPKGILSQSAEAKEKAHRINATIGIAKEQKRTMYFNSLMDQVGDLSPEDALPYAPSFGLPALRQAWQKEIYRKNESLADLPISLPVVTCGITHGVSVFADLWVNPGDVILMPDLMWGNYNMIFKVRKGADFISYPLFSAEGRYNLDAIAASLHEAAQKHAKVIVMFNFPQNPTGYSITRTEGLRLAELLIDVAAGGTNVIAVCDDAYFGLFYEDDVLKESIFSLLCGRHPRLLPVKLDGATKEELVWGLRVGFMTYGLAAGENISAVLEALEKKTAGCVRGTISNACHLSQTLLLRALQNPGHAAEKKAKMAILKDRALKVKAVLQDPRYASAWDVYPFNSGYFMCLRLKTVNAEKLRCHLLDRFGIGLIAINDQCLRVAFSSTDEADLPELFESIYTGIAELSA